MLGKFKLVSAIITTKGRITFEFSTASECPPLISEIPKQIRNEPHRFDAADDK